MLEVTERGDCDRWRRALPLAWQLTHPPDEFLSVETWHLDIADDDVRAHLVQHVERFASVSRDGDQSPAVSQIRSKDVASVVVILNDQHVDAVQRQHRRLGHRRASSTTRYRRPGSGRQRAKGFSHKTSAVKEYFGEGLFRTRSRHL